MGLERAGWRTVSFSEIDPYASAVLAERWPGVPNLGNVVDLASGARGRGDAGTDGGHDASPSGSGRGVESGDDGWYRAYLWTGGFPCQDLSVAGKRRGMVEGTRSNLAYAFLALVERHRPPAILLENVPGLLSSHGGRDMAALLGAMVELGYGVAYRVLDARHFGVPQRRRRVFILGLRSHPDDAGGRGAAERAAAVLSVGARCPRHPPTGVEAGPEPADGVGERPELVGAIPAGQHGFPDGVQHFRVVGQAPDPGGVRAADGLAGRLDDRTVAPTLLAPGAEGGRRDKIPQVVQALDAKAGGPDDNEAQAGHLIAFDPTTSLDQAPNTESYPPLKQGSGLGIGWAPAISGASGMTADDPLLPLGLDSHRYRCCGNGVVANVSYWLGRRLMEIAA